MIRIRFGVRKQCDDKQPRRAIVTIEGGPSFLYQERYMHLYEWIEEVPYSTGIKLLHIQAKQCLSSALLQKREPLVCKFLSFAKSIDGLSMQGDSIVVVKGKGHQDLLNSLKICLA